MPGTRFIYHDDPLQSDSRIESIASSDRKQLVLGRRVHILNNGQRKMGGIVTHNPSPHKSQTEAIYFKGPPGSGKSWAAYAVAGQSFFSEGRTWILLDTKFSFIGNNRGNFEFEKEIKSYYGRVLGIPGDQIDVIAPQYYVEGLSPQEIRDTWVTDYYRVPLRFCTLPVMFELTKMNKKAGYAGSFDQRFKDLLIRTSNRPKLSDVFDMLRDIANDPAMKRMKWVYDMMIRKIQEVARWTIDDGSDKKHPERGEWSAITECLFRAVKESQETGKPRARWIVFTLGHSEHPEDDMNLALVSCVLTEIYAFAKFARMHNLPISLGVMMDELHTYVRNKDASTRAAIHDLLFAWGRTSRVQRLFLSLPPDEKIWCVDENRHLHRMPIGTLIDGVLERHANQVHTYADKMYEAIEQPTDGWQVFVRNPETMRIELHPISAFIRHDNVDQLYKIELDDGREITTTGCHSIFTFDTDKLYPKAVEVKNLREGDWVEFTTELPFNNPTSSINLVKALIDHNIDLDTVRVRGLEYIQFLWDHYYDQILQQCKDTTKGGTERSAYNQFFSMKRKGGQIALRYLKNLPAESYSDANLLKYHATIATKPPAQPIPCIIQLNTDFWWLMGLITGDGAVTNQSTISIDCERSYLEKAKTIWQNVFGITNFSMDIAKRLHDSRGKDEQSGSLWVSHQVIWKFIHDILGIQSPAANKHVPELLFSQSNQAIKAYLDGYWSAEGFKQTPHWGIVTVSKQLAHDVLQLWGKLGTRCNVKRYERENNRWIYEVNVLDTTQQSTMNTFPLTYDMISKIARDEDITNTNFIRSLKYSAKKGSNIIEHSARKLASMCNCSEYTLRYKTVINGSSRFARIKKITPIASNIKVYDISVNGFENFISADHIVCHNTQKDEQLDKVFRDDITKIMNIGSYQTVLACEAIPEPGYAVYLNRLQSSPNAADRPYFIPKLKLCPPIFEVESNEPDDQKWLQSLRKKREAKRQTQSYVDWYPPAMDPRFQISPEEILSL